MVTENKIDDFEVGDLLEVVRNDNRRFECIVVEKYEGAFLGRVLNRDKSVGVSSWDRYSLDESSRVQSLKDCCKVTVLSKAESFEAKSRLTMKESVVKSDDVKYYKTKIDDENYVTLCICEGYGGWSFSKVESKALSESYLGSQVSRLSDQDK